jgi:hypothetical protein
MAANAQEMLKNGAKESVTPPPLVSMTILCS